jgi:hypothetical protein
MIAAAKPWAYWLAPILLAVTVLSLVVWAYVYYRKVVVPESYLNQWRDFEAGQRAALHAPERGAGVDPGRDEPRAELPSGQESAREEAGVFPRRRAPDRAVPR